MSEPDKRGKFQMLIVDRAIVIVSRKFRSKWWTIHCPGCSLHKRRVDGSCKHERAVLEIVKPELRSRTRINADSA